MIIELDNKNFKNAIKNGIKVVEFYMPECPYCIRQNEVLNDLGNIWLGQVGSKNSQDLIKEFDILTFPTFIIFNNINKSVKLNKIIFVGKKSPCSF